MNVVKKVLPKSTHGIREYLTQDADGGIAFCFQGGDSIGEKRPAHLVLLFYAPKKQRPGEAALAGEENVGEALLGLKAPQGVAHWVCSVDGGIVPRLVVYSGKLGRFYDA